MDVCATSQLLIFHSSSFIFIEGRVSRATIEMVNKESRVYKVLTSAP